MKKQSVMVKQVLMSIITAGMFTFGFSACSDELDNEARDMAAPLSECLQFTNLEQYSYSVPVEVSAKGDWTIDLQFEDEDHQFCYVYPREGHGPATVKLYMLDNWTETRNNGTMTISDLGNPNNNKVIALQQKCNLDNRQYSFTRGEAAAADDATAEEKAAKSGIQQGDIIYGVGYGYNVTKQPGINAIASNPIIALGVLQDSEIGKKYGYGPKVTGCSASTCVSTFTGSTVEEVTKKMEVSASIKGSKGGFSAEAGATYTASQVKSNTSMYAYTSVDVTVRKAYLEGIDGESVFDYLTPSAEAAINGTGKRGTYASTPQGFKRLFEDYGTHLIVKTDLGGRLRLGTTVDKSVTKDEQTVEAYANCSYKNKLLEAQVKSSASYKNSYENNKSKITTVISATGGNFTAAMGLSGEEKENKAATDAWIKSLEAYENLMVVGFGDRNAITMIPLYDLVDVTKEGGEERRAMMMAYMLTGMMEDDAAENTTEYAQGDIYGFEIPASVAKDCNGFNTPSGTLISEYSYNGKPVAWLCKEYIPKLSVNGLVAVVYPVENSKPNFQAGRFLGTAELKACDIRWNEDGTCTYSNLAEEKGMEDAVMLRGNRVITEKGLVGLMGGNMMIATEKPLYLKTAKATRNAMIFFGGGYSDCTVWKYTNEWLKWLKYDENYEYPLVKIGSRVWTRENYAGKIPNGSGPSDRYGSVLDNGRVYFTITSLSKATIPAGWHTAKSTDFNNLKGVISNDGNTLKFGERMQQGGASGFELEWNGWFTYAVQKIPITGKKYYHSYEQQKWQEHHMTYMTGDGYTYGIKDGNMSRGNKLNGENYAMQIRLVMDL